MNHEEVKRQLLSETTVREAYKNPPLALAVARAVIQFRRDRGMSQEELARLLDTSQNQVWRIESGDANISMKTLEKLRGTLGLTFTVKAPAVSTSLRQRATQLQPR